MGDRCSTNRGQMGEIVACAVNFGAHEGHVERPVSWQWPCIGPDQL